MRLCVKRVIFIIALCIAAVFAIVLRWPLHFHTDLTSLLNADSSKGWPIQNITGQFSSVMNVVIKTPDRFAGEKVAYEIRDMLQTDEFNGFELMFNDFSPRKFISEFGEYKNFMVSGNYRQILKSGDYAKITDGVQERIATSMSPNMLPLSVDPFLIVTDYVSELTASNTNWIQQNGLLWQYRAPDNFYMLPISVNINDNDKMASGVAKLQSRIMSKQTDSVQIYVGGVPVHTAQMYNRSKIEIGILSLLAVLGVIIVNYALFRRYLTIVPIGISLAVGFLVGTIALFLVFGCPHILVFVFGTSLIGLGIDYCFHSMCAPSGADQVNKNILHSLLTTVICFVPLLFSSIELLQQISVFTITGLCAIYLFIRLFIQKKIKPTNKKFIRPFRSKYRPYIVGMIACLACIACMFARVENNMSQMYRPSPELAESERLIADLNQATKSAFLIVRGDSIQHVLETEEDLRDAGLEFFGVSTVVPSLRRQIENQSMVRALYKSQSKNIQKTLGLRSKPLFTESPYFTISNKKLDFIRSQLDRFFFYEDQYVYSISSMINSADIQNDNARIVVPVEMIKTTMEKYSNETYNLLIVCGICLLIVLLILYRKRALLYVVPPLLGAVVSVGFLTCLGMPITFFHLLGLFIVIGLGLDYAIFHINTQSGAELRPVFYSCITSVIGFGLLAFTSFFLIAAMGITLAIGITVSYLVSLYLFWGGGNTVPRRR